METKNINFKKSIKISLIFEEYKKTDWVLNQIMFIIWNTQYVRNVDSLYIDQYASNKSQNGILGIY